MALDSGDEVAARDAAEAYMASCINFMPTPWYVKDLTDKGLPVTWDGLLTFVREHDIYLHKWREEVARLAELRTKHGVESLGDWMESHWGCRSVAFYTELPTDTPTCLHVRFETKFSGADRWFVSLREQLNARARGGAQGPEQAPFVMQFTSEIVG